MYKGKYRNKHSHIQKRTIIISVIVATLIVVGGVLAKYVYNNGGKFLMSANEFYFTSNLLTENTAKYVLNSTTTEISFTLGNNADKLRFSQVDIIYDITVSCKSGENYSDENIKYEDTVHILTGGAGVDETTVTLQNLKMGETYIVTATGNAGYKQVLTAEFYVTDKEENIYMHLDTSNDAYVLLTVWAENISGDLTINFPNPNNTNKEIKGGLIPDNTDPVLRNVYNYEDGEYGAMNISDKKNFTDSYSSYTYRFFVSKSANYSADDFSVFIEKNGATCYAQAKEEIPQ